MRSGCSRAGTSGTVGSSAGRRRGGAAGTWSFPRVVVFVVGQHVGDTGSKKRRVHRRVVASRGISGYRLFSAFVPVSVVAFVPRFTILGLVRGAEFGNFLRVRALLD